MIPAVTEDSTQGNVVFAKSTLRLQLLLHLSYFAKQDEESIAHTALLKKTIERLNTQPIKPKAIPATKTLKNSNILHSGITPIW